MSLFFKFVFFLLILKVSSLYCIVAFNTVEYMVLEKLMSEVTCHALGGYSVHTII